MALVAPTTQAIFQVLAMHPSFLYASTIPLFGGIGLNIYRSTALPTSDPWYLPVKEYLAGHRYELLRSVTVPDDSMMFGEAEHSIYKIKDKTWQK